MWADCTITYGLLFLFYRKVRPIEQKTLCESVVCPMDIGTVLNGVECKVTCDRQRQMKRNDNMMLDRFTAKQMVRIIHAPICFYEADGIVSEYLEKVEEQKIIEPEYFAFARKGFPTLHVEKNGVAHALLWNEQEQNFVGLGKLRIYDFGDEDAKKYAYCPKETFVAVIVILWKLMTGQEVGEQELLEKNIFMENSVDEQLTKDIYRWHEEGGSHNPYSQEQWEQDCIVRGDIQGLKESFDEVYSGKVGILANDELRHCKNIAICVIAISSRSAIKGGLNPELSFSMSDAFIKNIEENLNEPMQIERATRQAEIEFAQQVKQMQRTTTDNPMITQVKDYVFQHINEPVLVRDIADYVGVTPNYLSEQFHRNMKITLKQYILEEKIIASERLLKYTDYSIQEISNYCAFSSQSRFSEYFQRKNGITPAKFRKKYKL